MEEEELTEFEQAGTRLFDLLMRFRKGLSPRDLAMLTLGMRASHIEEALATGDVDRARAHFTRLVTAISSLP